VILVSDTGPVIALAKIKHLNILQILFDEVHIPRTVYKELMAKPGEEGSEIDKALNDFIKINDENIKSEKVNKVVANLGKGERETLEIACYLNKSTVIVLMDDRAGRAACKQLKLHYTGTGSK